MKQFQWFALVLVVQIFVLNGCEKVDDTFRERSIGPDAVLRMRKYNYPFGTFTAREHDDPLIERFNLPNPPDDRIILWVDGEPLHARALALEAFDGDFKKRVTGEEARDLGERMAKKIKNSCIVLTDEKGNFIRLNLGPYIGEKLQLSIEEDGAKLTLPCRPAELIKCLGKPQSITDYP